MVLILPDGHSFNSDANSFVRHAEISNINGLFVIMILVKKTLYLFRD